MRRKSNTEIIAEALGVNPQTIRLGLEQGKFPFGTAVQCDKRYSYIYYPEKVKEYIGISLGENNEGHNGRED